MYFSLTYYQVCWEILKWTNWSDMNLLIIILYSIKFIILSHYPNRWYNYQFAKKCWELNVRKHLEENIQYQVNVCKTQYGGDETARTYSVNTCVLCDKLYHLLHSSLSLLDKRSNVWTRGPSTAIQNATMPGNNTREI